jgi:hypothetical protein
MIVNSDGSINIAGVTIGSVSIAAGSETYIKGGSVSVYDIVAGSIVSMPAVSVSAGSESYIKGGSISVYGVGSIYATNQYLGSKVWQGERFGVSGIVDITTRIAGSIVNMPNITIDSPSTIGSYSIQTIDGNVGVSGTAFSNILGSVTITAMPAINVSTGSENYIMNFGDLGSSVVVTNLYEGSKAYQGDVYGVSGIIEVSNRVAGSIVNLPDVVGVSGTYFQNMIGSVRSQNVQITNPWVVSGNVLVSGTVGIRSPETIGSWTGCVGSIWSMPSISVSVGSESYIKAGSVEVYNMVAGSIVYMPSINVSVGSEFYIKGGSLDGVSQVAGSIWSMPSVSVSAGSESWIKGGSIHLYSGTSYIDIPNRVAGSIVNMPIVGVSGTYFSDMIGSVRAQVVQITTPWQMAGSIWSMPDISVSTGSETYIKGGSIHLYSGTSYIDVANVVQTAGSIWSMPSVTANAGSEQWIKGGSIHLYSGTSFIDVTNTVQIAGSIWSIPNVEVSLTTGSEQWIKGGSIQTYNPIGVGSIMQGVSPFHVNKTPLTYTGSLIVSGGAANIYIGSHVVTLNNEINWISIIGSAGSSYNFEVRDSEGYTILSNLPRIGRLSYMTPFLASGDIVFIISGAQVSGNYPLRIGYI